MMLRCYNIVRLLVVALLLTCVSHSASSGNLKPEAKLQAKLNNAKTHDQQMEAISDIAEENFGNNEEVVYLKKLYNLAQGNLPNDNKWKAYAISRICRFYYNSSEVDSMIIWAKKIDQIKVVSEVHDSYFDARYFLCSAYLIRNDVEKALGVALDLQKEAKMYESVNGEVTCYELMGDVYMKAKAYSKAIKAYALGFNTLKRQNMRFSYQFQFVTQIMECSNACDDYNTFHTYLPEMKHLLDDDKKMPKSREALYERCLKLYYAYELLDNVRHVKTLEAEKSYEKLIGFKHIDDWFVEARTTRTLAEYYTLNGQYNKALDELCKLDSSGIDTPYGLSYSKGVLLQRLQRYEDAGDMFVHSFDTLAVEYSKFSAGEFRQFSDACLEQYEKRVENEEVRDRRHTITVLVAFGCIMVLIFFLCSGYLFLRSRLLNKRLGEQQIRLLADKKVLEERSDALDKTLKQVRRDGELKTMFLSNMSHDIRNPLNAIVGFCDILVQNATHDSKQCEYARIINENSESLMSLVNNVLDLGRIDSGRVAIQWHKVELVELLAESSAAHACKPEVKNIIDMDQKVQIVSDSTRLTKVMDNVYSNAFRFTERGHVKTTVEVASDEVVVRIEDTGIGIPAEKAEVIFECFEKLDTFTQGTGLGLSVCRKLMTLLHGTIKVDTTYREGLAMVITLPTDPSAITTTDKI